MSPPIFQSATYDLDAAAYEDIARTGGERTWWYSRLGNPTVAAVAAKLAALEQAEEAVVLSSGMAAIATTLLALLPPGGRVVAARELYGDVVTLLRDELPRHGRSAAFVAVDDLAGFRRELAAGADLLYVETLSNPMLRVADVGALSAVAREAGALSVVDATFTPPVGAGTLALGADLVVHSATKYLNGHSDLVAGVVAGRAAAVAPVRAQMAILGGCLDPHAAFLLDRGLKTLAVRVARHQETALALARRLAGHPEVEHVAHPGLPDHPDHALAARALPGGCGLVTIRVRGGDERARRVLDALRVVRQATSLGGVESLASTPHNTSHLGLDAAARAEAGILPGTIRLSVGLEELADLAGDLEQALAATAAVRA
jgi:cystathionine beta-lyase/cystathionine gamma-synthase